jgi:hypothetical protein
MGPGSWPPDPPKVAIVSAAEIAEQGTLSADYFVNRQPGESWTAFRVRKQAEDAERRAAAHEATAMHLRAEAGTMRLHAGLPGPEHQSAEYERGRADMLADLAAMDPADRALLLSRARHPSGGTR